MDINKVILIVIMAFSISIPALSFAALADSHQYFQNEAKEKITVKTENSTKEVTKAVKKGLIQPFSVLHAKIEKELYGRIIEVELEEDDEQWHYEIKLMYNNNIIEVEYDAFTLKITEIESRDVLSVIKGLK